MPTPELPKIVFGTKPTCPALPLVGTNAAVSNQRSTVLLLGRKVAVRDAVRPAAALAADIGDLRLIHRQRQDRSAP